MAEKNGEGLIDTVFKLLDTLPPEIKTWAVVALLIGGGIWWWRKNSEKEKTPENSRSVNIRGKAENNTIITGDNNRVKSDNEKP